MNLGNQGGGRPPLDINVNLKTAETVKCASCGGMIFDKYHVLKRVPKIMIGAPTDIPVPVPIWVCGSCGDVAKDFIPPAVGTFEDLFGVDDGPHMNVPIDEV